MEDPNSTSWRIFDYVYTALGGVAVLIWGVINKKIDDNNKAVHARIKETNATLDKHEEVYGKIFDKMEHMTERSEDRHKELITALHIGLNSKVDK